MPNLKIEQKMTLFYLRFGTPIAFYSLVFRLS